MNAAQKKVVKAEAYALAYSILESRIQDYKREIEMNTERITEETQGLTAKEIDEYAESSWRMEDNEKLKQTIEIYQKVMEEIIK